MDRFSNHAYFYFKFYDRRIGAETKVIKLTAQKYDFIPETINVNFGDKVMLEVTVTDKEHGFWLDALSTNQGV